MTQDTHNGRETAHRAMRLLLAVVIVASTFAPLMVGSAAAQTGNNATNPCAFGPPVPGQDLDGEDDDDDDDGDLEVAMVNDRSGSMSTGTRMEDLRNASSEFVARLDAPAEATAVSFGPASENDVTVDEALTDNLPAVESAIEALQVTSGGSGTYLEGGISTGADQLVNSPIANSTANKVMVIATDAQSGGIDESAAIQAADDARAAGVDEIYAIGIGGSVDEQLLNDITNDSSNVYLAPDSSDLDGIYESISGDVRAVGGSLRVETRDLFTPGATHDYDVYNVTFRVDSQTNETVRTKEEVTQQATLTSSNTSVLSVDEPNTSLIATDDANTSTWVRVNASTANRTGCTNVIVAQPTLENLELVPGIWRVVAVANSSTLFALIIATLLAVPAARFTSAFGGLAMAQLIIVVGWLAGYVGFGIAAASLFTSLFIGLNLAANIDYQAGFRR